MKTIPYPLHSRIKPQSFKVLRLLIGLNNEVYIRKKKTFNVFTVLQHVYIGVH